MRPSFAIAAECVSGNVNRPRMVPCDGRCLAGRVLASSFVTDDRRERESQKVAAGRRAYLVLLKTGRRAEEAAPPGRSVQKTQEQERIPRFVVLTTYFWREGHYHKSIL